VAPKQAHKQAHKQALKRPLENAINECVSTSKACQQPRLAEVNQLPAVYSPIVPRADVYGPTMDDYRLRVAQGSTGSLLWAARVRVAQSMVDLHFADAAV
jgi:hypothetical protein